MWQVKGEKLLRDYEALYNKREAACAAISDAARVFAINRGYDEAQTEDYVAYVLKIEKYGLTKDESDRLSFLAAYVEEKDDEADISEAVNNGEVIY